MNEQILELDLNKRGITPACVTIGQGDKGGTTIKALLYDNGSALDLSGCTVWLVAQLPNKRNYYRGQCSVSGNAATITVDEEKLCSVAGYTDKAYFSVEKGASKASTERFAIEIAQSALDGKTPAKDWDNKIDSLVSKGEQAEKAEAGRKEAESKRVSAEDTRQQQESARVSAERTRAAAESDRTAAEQARAEAEKARVEAEKARAAAESARAAAEKARQDTEKLRAAAEQARAEAERLRETAQAKNNADQAANNSAAQGLQVVKLAEGQYDKATGKPTVSGAVGKLYFVPASAVKPDTLAAMGVQTGDDTYIEWMWLDGKWEHIGMSNATLAPLTTAEVDRIAAGESVTSEGVVNGSTLTYTWAKIKGAFAALVHRHKQSDIDGLADALAGKAASTHRHPKSQIDGLESDLSGIRDSLSQWSTATLSDAMEKQGVIRYKKIGNTLFVHACDLRLKGAIKNDDRTVLATGFTHKSSEAFLLQRTDGYILRVKVDASGNLVMHYPHGAESSDYEFYCMAAAWI